MPGSTNRKACRSARHKDTAGRDPVKTLQGNSTGQLLRVNATASGIRRGSVAFLFSTWRNDHMADEENDKNTGGSTDTGGGAGDKSGEKSGDDKSKWTAKEWESYADRRANDAAKARDTHFKTALAAKDQDAATTLAAMKQSIADAEAKATFADAAVASGMKDIRGGFAIAQTLGYLKDGKIDMDAMKKNHPGLFAGPPDTKAGPGTQNSTPPLSFNEALRSAAKG